MRNCINIPWTKVYFDCFSFKLGDIYTRYTSKQASNAHNAEGDVNMLIMCAATLGDEFVDWANRNAKKFLDIPIMTPGMRLY